MKLTLAQARELGIDVDNLIKDRVPVINISELPPSPSKAPNDGMNKLERAFWERLQQAVKDDIFLRAYREPMTLRLAGNTRYKPDFLTNAVFNNRMTFWETKGFMRDDAAVKLKVAAAQFPHFRWVLVQRDRGRWRCINVTEKGFSREEYCPDWLR